MSPTISTKKTAQRSFTSRQALERETLVFLIACGVAAGTVLIHLAGQATVTHRNSSALARKLTAENSDRFMKAAEIDRRENEERQIADKAKTENTAWLARAKEFEARAELGPELAHTPREQAMLKMKEIGADPNLTPAQALEKMAWQALPAGASPKPVVKVTDDKGALSLDISYPCPAVMKGSPFGNWPPGYYHEVVRTTAGIVKDVMAFGGTRAPQEMLVACWTNVKVTKAKGGGSTEEPRHQFIVTAEPDARDWLHMTRAEVEQAWNKRTDNLRALIPNQ
jgi:hypothetical protein